RDNFSDNPARRPVERTAHVSRPSYAGLQAQCPASLLLSRPTRIADGNAPARSVRSPVVRYAVRETSPSAERTAFWPRSPTLGRRGCQSVKQPHGVWAGQYGANMSIALQKDP